MMDLLKPLRATSLKEVFVERFEDLILSGQLPIGAKLPPERALAERLGVSRPVVHAGLVELAARGLVTVRPRVGTVVNDYRREGSLALLASLVNHREGAFAPSLLHGLLSMRALLQTEAVRLAAVNRSDDELAELEAIVERQQREKQKRGDDRAKLETIVDLDFSFHHMVALASGNPIYPMLVKSFEPAERNLARQFFCNRELVADVFDRHRTIVEAIRARDQRRAVELMTELLDHGSDMLERQLERNREAEARPEGSTSASP